jgi:HSP20 family protein
MANLPGETDEKRQGGTKMLVTWTPFNELARLQQGFDHLLRTNGTPNHRERVAGFTPPVDVVEDEQKFELYADLPGVTQEDLDIQVEKDVLTIKGTRKLERKGERVSGAFSRSFTLPKHVDVTQIAASLKDGVLLLTLPKRPEAQPRQIKIAVK